MLKSAAPAHILYGTPEFEVVVPGSYVLCAVTGQRIDLHDLKYWSAEFQEAYLSAEQATAAFVAGGAKNLPNP
ncbi:MAG: DUF2093 domain-containing protein [Sphingomonadales bacterium]|nr:MAG: DUF2093 domain-containing protein [Sphingomonadales bacterium]